MSKKNDNDKLSKEFKEFLEFKKYKQQIHQSEQPAQTSESVDAEKPTAVVEQETVSPEPVDRKRMAMVAYLQDVFALKDKSLYKQLDKDNLKKLIKILNRFFMFSLISYPCLYVFVSKICVVAQRTPLTECLTDKASLVNALDDLSTWIVWGFLICFVVFLMLGSLVSKMADMKKGKLLSPLFDEKKIDYTFYFQLYPRIIRFFSKFGQHATEKEFKKLRKAVLNLYISFLLVAFMGIITCVAWIFFTPVAHLKLVHACANPSNFQIISNLICLIIFICNKAFLYIWIFRLIQTIWINRRIKKRIKRERKRA